MSKEILLNDLLIKEMVGGRYTSKREHGLFHPSIPVDSEAYNWDDSTGAKEGFKLTLTDENYLITKVHVYGHNAYPLRDVKIYFDDVVVDSVDWLSASRPFYFETTPKKCKTVEIYRFRNVDSVITRIHVFGVKANGFVLKQHGEYYSIKDEHYDTTTKSYRAIENLSKDNFTNYITYNIGDLMTEKTIGDETFYPVDKFNNFQLVTEEQSVNIIKSSLGKELVVGKSYISLKIAENIDYFEHEYNILGNSDIKIAVDDGTGIKYTNDNGNSWVPSSLVLPKINEYSDLNNSQKIVWDEIKNEVFEKGFSIKDTRNINFNTLNSEKIRFLYVLDKKQISDDCRTKSLKMQFDSKGSFTQLDKRELEIEQTDYNIKLKALKNIDLLKVNINSSEDIGSENIEIDITEEEMDQFILGGWNNSEAKL